MEFGAAAHKDRRLALAYAFEAEKFLVEFARLGEVVALQGAVREHRRLHDRLPVVRREDRVFDRHHIVHRRLPGLAGLYHDAAASSASVRNASAKSSASGRPHWALKSRRAASTITGAPQA